MTYTDSARFLYSLGNELKIGAKWGLEKVQTLMAALGNPERADASSTWPEPTEKGPHAP
jgi:hypothetical protein